jgi:thiol:disulfide interchange protein DsbD
MNRKKLIWIFMLGGLIGQLCGQPINQILQVKPYLATNGVYPGGAFKLAVVVSLSDSWHINSATPTDKFVIATRLNIEESNQYTITDIHYPPHLLKTFSYTDQPLAVYAGEIAIIVYGELTKNVQESVLISGNLDYQGCNDQLCLPPQETAFELTLPILSSTEPVEFRNEAYFKDVDFPAEPVVSTVDIKSSFSQKGVLLTLLLIFLGGLGLNLTPCIYPLIPITISYFGGQATGYSGRRLLLAILYVLGLAIVNSLLGTVAALSGSLVGTLLTNPVVLIIIAGILVALALSMFGVYEFSVPHFLMNLGGGSRRGYLGALVMGLTMGIVAAPCIGPFVIGLLIYVASTGNPLIGFSLFFTLSLGLGLPFILLAFFASKIEKLPRSGEWMTGVRIIFGLILIGMAIYFIRSLLPGNLFTILFAVYLIMAGGYLLLFNRTGDNARGFVYIKRITAIAAIILGTWLLKPPGVPSAGMEWEIYRQENFDALKSSGKPLIIDFYADWCIPCKELDKLTFSDPRIIELSHQFNLLKVNLSSMTNPAVNQLKEQYQVRGVPTILFFDRTGQEIPELRVLGFEEPENFVTKMDQVLSNH